MLLVKYTKYCVYRHVWEIISHLIKSIKHLWFKRQLWPFWPLYLKVIQANIWMLRVNLIQKKKANLKDMGDHGLINMKIEDICKTKISNCLFHSFRCITDLLLPVKYKSLCIFNKKLSRIIWLGIRCTVRYGR